MNMATDQAGATANVDASGTQGSVAAPASVDGKGAEGLASGSDGAAASGTEQQADLAGKEGASTEGAAAKTPEQIAAEADAAKAAEANAGAPEVYADFVMPEGLTLDPELTTDFKEIAKADNLSQEKAQKYVDAASKLVQKTIKTFQDQHAERIAQWAEQVKADPVVGGRNYESNIKDALAVVGEYGDAELKETFDTYGLGNNPAIIRFVHRIAQSMKEGGFVHGKGREQPGAPVNKEQALAKRIEAEQARNKA
jgi:hypothetical protein